MLFRQFNLFYAFPHGVTTCILDQNLSSLLVVNGFFSAGCCLICKRLNYSAILQCPRLNHSGVCSKVWQVHLMSGKTTHQYPHLKEWKLHFMDIYVRNVDQNPLKRIHSGNFTLVTLLLTGMWQRMQIKTQRNDVSTFLNEQLHCFEDQIQRNNTGSRKYISFLVVKGKTDLSVYNIQRK